MTLTAGALSVVSVSSTSASLVSAVATSGTAPYTYQWYRSTASGFSPGGGNIISGATSLSLTDTGLIPGTQYYYKVVVTDSVAATATSSQLAVQTQPQVQSPNSLVQSPQLGMLDLRFNPDTVSVEVDQSQVGSLPPGSAVKVVDSVGGVPKVVGCAADSDEVAGFIVYDIKTQSFVPGQPCEIAMAQNVMYLFSTGAISRFQQVCLDLTTIGGVSAPVTGNKIVGFAYDKAPAAGSLIRVKLQTPSYLLAP